jgi:hypothetical protein
MNVPAKVSAPSFASAGLVPSNMAEAMRLAEMMATARLVPTGLQKSPADCLMVIQQAIRWEMDPFAVAQECSVIQGKLMHSGKLVAAVINARGGLVDRLSYAYEGEGDDRTIKVSGRLRGEAQPRDVTVRLGDAKTTNRVWQTQPDQQLMYHGARVWARRHTPELMLGVNSPEEFEPRHDPQTGEITESADVETPPRVTDAAPPVVGSHGGAAVSIEDRAREAANRGAVAMREFWLNCTKEEQPRVNKIRPELNKLVDAAEAQLALEMDDDGSDDNGAHLKLVEAFRHGQQAKADGHLRRAIPPEYREPNAKQEAQCWEAGWLGESMPEFNTAESGE